MSQSEDQIFWQGIYPVMFNKDRLEEGPKDVEKILKLIDSPKGLVLDLACGPGRHAIAFAKNGYNVTAADQSEFLLAKGKVAADKAGVKIEFVRADMRDFRRENAYGLALACRTYAAILLSKQLTAE